MNHLSEDQIYDLAVKVSAEADLTPEEGRMLKHAAECDECYRLLCCMMAMVDAAEHVGELAKTSAPAPIREKISAVIRLAVDAVNSVLNQIEAGSDAWAFRRAPMALTGVRSGLRRAGAAKKLTDASNSQTFVAYDPAKKLLMIQIDSGDCDGEPKAHITVPGGERISVEFEKRENVYWAVVPDLAEGQYEITLEK